MKNGRKIAVQINTLSNGGNKSVVATCGNYEIAELDGDTVVLTKRNITYRDKLENGEQILEIPNDDIAVVRLMLQAMEERLGV